MLLTAPFVIYGIFRVLYLIHHGGLDAARTTPPSSSGATARCRPASSSGGSPPGVITLAAVDAARTRHRRHRVHRVAHRERRSRRPAGTVRTLDVNPPAPGERRGHEFVQADTRDAAAMREAVRGCEVVVENAALVPVTRSSEAEYRSVNVDGCRTTLDAAEAEGAYVVRHLVERDLRHAARSCPRRRTRRSRRSTPTGAARPRRSGMVAERRAAGPADREPAAAHAGRARAPRALRRDLRPRAGRQAGAGVRPRREPLAAVRRGGPVLGGAGRDRAAGQRRLQRRQLRATGPCARTSRR